MNCPRIKFVRFPSGRTYYIETNKNFEIFFLCDLSYKQERIYLAIKIAFFCRLSKKNNAKWIQLLNLPRYAIRPCQMGFWIFEPQLFFSFQAHFPCCTYYWIYCHIDGNHITSLQRIRCNNPQNTNTYTWNNELPIRKLICNKNHLST